MDRERDIITITRRANSPADARSTLQVHSPGCGTKEKVLYFLSPEWERVGVLDVLLKCPVYGSRCPWQRVLRFGADRHMPGI